MRPLIKYYGGKQRIADRIVQALPPHATYVEPFAGGLAVLYAKPLPKSNYIEVINDTNEAVINMYRVAKSAETRDRFMEMCQATLYSRAEYNRAKDIYENGHECDVTRAWALWVNARMSFGSMIGAGFGYEKSPNRFKISPIVFDDFKKNYKIYERLGAVFIEQDDALKIITRYDSPWTVHYCDPPYVGTDQGHYKGYTQDDFDKLLTTLSDCKGSFVLSHYHNPAVPKDWDKIEIKTQMSASRKKDVDTARTEILYIKDRSDTCPEEHRKHLVRFGQRNDQMDLFS